MDEVEVRIKGELRRERGEAKGKNAFANSTLRVVRSFGGERARLERRKVGRLFDTTLSSQEKLWIDLKRSHRSRREKKGLWKKRR